METAGAEDMPEDAERKGLGTPATRAATLEKLVSAGFVQRKKKQLIPTEKGRNLIAVLPDNIKSPILTAEWESMLKQVERIINLTSKEFDILALLIANPKRVFTYELITDLVWKEDCDFYSRKAIHNHISKLRKKLRFEPDLPNYIESVSGIGYKFEHL